VANNIFSKTGGNDQQPIFCKSDSQLNQK